MLYVNCDCSGENCKLNIAGVIRHLRRKSALLPAALSASVFALQLLTIMASVFHRWYWHGCMVMLFLCLLYVYRSIVQT